MFSGFVIQWCRAYWMPFFEVCTLVLDPYRPVLAEPHDDDVSLRRIVGCGNLNEFAQRLHSLRLSSCSEPPALLVDVLAHQYADTSHMHLSCTKFIAAAA